MGLTVRIAQASGVALLRIGSLELIAFDDAERFLTAVAKEDLIVLGIEGFRVVAGQVIPEMNAIADFSTYSSADPEGRSLQDARRFLERVAAPGMFFEFELERRR